MSIICEMKNIGKRFGDRKIFNNFNMTVSAGEMVCVSGKSGAGKSTLLNMVGMLEDPDEGEVYLFGKLRPSINSSAGRKLMKNKIFYVFQNFALIESESVYKNMEIPLVGQNVSKKERSRMISGALEKVGLSGKENEKIYHLSGGEQQRVALARGYLKDFELLLADEPTGSLDVENRDIVMDIFRGFHKRGKSILIVSHDRDIVAQCERVIAL